ncbi:MAG TPA: ABC transporter permease [Candidatus Polarisedimenticolia bacterium]|jgi:ABC-2 type transport system permease protein|nr:ABC transporter permease [Candidatus Polarisedimenticolia bacterium]
MSALAGGFLPLPFRTLFFREVHRFFIVINQTLLAPVISALLYLFIFGFSLGSRFGSFHGHSYLHFLIPGLVMMGLVNNSFQNPSSSLMISKFEGNIVDILMAPIGHAEIIAGYMLGGMFRGLLVGTCILAAACLFGPPPFAHPLYLILVALLSAALFSLAGVTAGIWAEKFDDLALFPTFIITPLTYLGGVFYSIDTLPPFWRNVSLINPLLYMINALRYGFLGVSDVDPGWSLAALSIVTALLFGVCLQMLRSGYRLRK